MRAPVPRPPDVSGGDGAARTVDRTSRSRWFVWMPDALYVATRVGDTTWEALEHDARISLLVDRGRGWNDLSGVRIEGVAELLPAEHPDLRQPMSAWHEKYRTLFAGDGFERFTAAIRGWGSSAWRRPSWTPGTTDEVESRSLVRR